MTPNKLKKLPENFLKHNIYYRGAVTEYQKISDNFHRHVLYFHKKKKKKKKKFKY
jgi:hypothetical protein